MIQVEVVGEVGSHKHTEIVFGILRDDPEMVPC